VSDGKARTSLRAFTLTVNQTANGRATITWTPPTANTDGSALTNLAGYIVMYGRSASELDNSEKVSNPSVSTALIENLTPGTWYFAVKAYTTSGAQSALSVTGSKTVQ
jgi:hypothetical protein